MLAHSLGSEKNRLLRIQSLTVEAAQRVDDLVFSFGHLREGDPEREILKRGVEQILRKWAQAVRAYGGTPRELWTVSIETPKGTFEWQYPCSAFQEFLENDS